jgi:hypothetical protein
VPAETLYALLEDDGIAVAEEGRVGAGTVKLDIV